MGTVVSLTDFKKNKESRQSSVVSEQLPLGARIERIKASITRINELMAELRKDNKHADASGNDSRNS